LPPVPRQPSMHALVAVSQTRPELVSPQSASVMQPQTLFGRHALPVPLAEQGLLVGVHCSQVFVDVSQTRPPLHCRSDMHSTHTCGMVAVLHTRSGATVQSLSVVQWVRH
jgi:hypothetical protein